MVDRSSLLRIGELAKRAGVSVDTIGFYVREGLLPPPTLKTSRNMAWYDETFVDRIRIVRRLQHEQRLPLREIKALVTGSAGDDPGATLAELEARVAGAITLREEGEPIDREALLARTGVAADDLDALEALGLVTKQRTRGARYEPIDVAIVETVARARKVGLDRERFPASDLAIYRDAVAALVDQEVPLFLTRTRGRPEPKPAAALVEAAVHLLGQLLLQLRRKRLLEVLAPAPAKRAGTKKRARKKA